MTLDEAIKHCEEVAQKLKTEAEWINPNVDNSCLKCAKEHEQLADWLKELKAYKEDCHILTDAAYSDLCLRASKYEDRPKGKWIILDDCSNEGVYCSECHKKVFKIDYSNTVKIRSNYCPNCGADMREEQE